MDDAAVLSPEIMRIISDRPPHWESKLLQSALRLAADELNAMFETATTSGISPGAFLDGTRTFLSSQEQLLREWQLVIEDELATASGWTSKSSDPDLIIKAVDHLIGVTRDAIILQQRAAVLAHHPIFGALAIPLRETARTCIEAYNDLLRRLDDQLPNIDTTPMDLRHTFCTPPSLEEMTVALDNFGSNFLDEQNHTFRTGDVVKDRFQIARGEQALGEFGRNAIGDNLAAGLFQPGDWYWSDDSQQGKPLSSLA